ncbi:MAG TPA: YtxH domain-containing protein [Actinobacteria bacterium]|nr:YtxH domain-containing protein [Actinomycetota bacterium]
MDENKGFGFEEFGMGLLLGAILGAVAGLLVAPQSGAITRKQISDRAEEAKEIAEDLFQQTKGRIEVLIERAESLLGLQETVAWKKIESLRADLKKYDLSGA